MFLLPVPFGGGPRLAQIFSPFASCLAVLSLCFHSLMALFLLAIFFCPVRPPKNASGLLSLFFFFLSTSPNTLFSKCRSTPPEKYKKLRLKKQKEKGETNRGFDFMDQCFAIDHPGCVPDRQAADELSAVMKERQEKKISRAFLNLSPGKGI